MKVVINRFSSQHAVSLEQIEKAIRLPVAIKLPNGYAEVVALRNSGRAGQSQAEVGVLRANPQVGAAIWRGRIWQCEEVAAPKKSKFSLWK